MSGFISEISEDCGSFLWPCCQDCVRQKECPYVYDQILCHGAHQGKAEAQRLTAEASRALETISNAEDIRSLLDSGKALERALTQGLSSEMALINYLRRQTERYCP